MDKNVVDMPEISIIMPVYNAEKTVERMLDSIISQTFRDWELIAVDDGSSDNSSRILDSYAIKDSRIHVIHKSNAGVAAARQDGIDRATGAYTIHADSDDWTEPRMLEEMLSVAKTEKADIVIADFYTDIEGHSSKVTVQRPESLDTSDILYGLYVKDLFGGLCHKLIKKSAYAKANAKFHKDVNYCEDLLLLTQLLTNSQPKVAYIPKAYYHYIVNSSSLTQCVSAEGLASMRRFHSIALTYLPDNGRFSDIRDSFSVDEFTVMFMNRLYPDTISLKEEALKLRDSLRQRYGLRWKIGLWCIDNGLISMAHKLIKF